MTFFKVNPDQATSGEFEVLPAGDYECFIESGAVKKSAAGNEYLDFKLKVRDDVEGQKYGGRILWGKLHFTEGAMGVTQGFLIAMGAPKDKEFASIEDVKNYVVGKATLAKVKVTQYQGTDRNEVSYMNASKVGGGKIDDPLAEATGGVLSNDPFASGGGPIELTDDDDLPF